MCVLPPFIHGYIPSFYIARSHRISLFVPKASSTIFGFLWAFLQDCPLTRWLPDLYLCLEYGCCTTLHFRTKPFVLFLPLTFSTLPEWIRIVGSFFTYLYDMHQVALAHCLPLLGEMSS